MKPSEALEIGMRLFPRQAFGSGGVGNARCAYTAIQDVLTEHDESPGIEPAVILLSSAACPVCGDLYEGIAASFLVVHLNDDHKWKREAVQQWLWEQGL